MLDGLDAINWSELRHAYGHADDVPSLLRALASKDKQERGYAICELHSNIWHQGTVYQATAHAVPFLVELLDVESVEDKVGILVLLESISTGSSYLDVHQSMDHRHNQRETAEFKSAVEEQLEWVRAAHNAVVDGTETYISLLQHGDSDTRQSAAQVLMTCVERHGQVDAALRTTACEDKDEAVCAKAIFALSSLWNGLKRRQGSADDERERLLRFISVQLEVQAQAPMVRLAAAIVYVDISGPAVIDEMMPIFNECMEIDPGHFRRMWAGDLQDPFVAIGAALAVDPEQEAGWILEHFRDDSAKIRRSALMSGRSYCQRWRSGPAKFVMPIAELLADANDDVRWQAAWTLGTIGSVVEEVEHRLIAAQEDPADLVREKIALALDRVRNGNPGLDVDSRLRFPEHEEEPGELVRLLDGPHKRLNHRQWKERLGILHGISRSGASAASALPVLRELLHCNDEWQRVLAARAIWAIRHEADEILPVLTGELSCRPTGILALDCLAEMGALAADAIPTLQHLVDADERAPQDGSSNELVDKDEAFMAVCERMLVRLQRATE